jgi:sugar lactone lactonase YvrE
MRVTAPRWGRLEGAIVFVTVVIAAAAVLALAARPAAALMNNEQYGFLNQIGGPGTGPWTFGNASNPAPYGVAVDADGNVFALDPNGIVDGTHSFRVQKFGPDGSHICGFGNYGSDLGGLSSPYGIAVDSAGTVYVLDTWRADQDRIQKFSPSDAGRAYVSSGQISIAPLAGDAFFMAVDAAGNMYVSETNGGPTNDVNCVLKYAPAGGAPVATIGSTGTGVGKLSGPNGVSVSPDGSDVYIANSGASNVKRFHSTDGIHYSEAQVFTASPSDLPLDYPVGLAIDAAGDVFVIDQTVDTMSNPVDRIVKFDAAGDVVTSWGARGAGNYEMRFPSGIAVSSTGCVYVCDSGGNDGLHPEFQTQNHRILRFARDLTPPASSVTGVPAGWTNAAEVALGFTGADPVVADRFTSGYQFTQLFLNGGWSAYVGSLVVRDEGVTTVRYRAADFRNNFETEQSLQVRLDRTRPTIADSAVPSGWSKSPVPVAFSGDDALSGVARTEYSTDAGATWTVADAVTVPASGPTTLSYRCVDHAGNVSDTKTATVLADGVKPAPRPLADIVVRRGKTARFRYRVADSACPQAQVWIKVRKRGTTLATLSLGARSTGLDLTKAWKCKLLRGRYTWTVWATDLAGNPQARLVSKRLIVR